MNQNMASNGHILIHNFLVRRRVSNPRHQHLIQNSNARTRRPPLLAKYLFISYLKEKYKYSKQVINQTYNNTLNL